MLPVLFSVKARDYDNFSVYLNLDNGAGKIRGIYTEGNAAARPIFESWLVPFHDLGATHVTLNSTGSTDHESFRLIGLPGYQFIQDRNDDGASCGERVGINWGLVNWGQSTIY